MLTERQREIQKRYRDHHREEINARRRTWVKAHPKEIQKAVASWRAKARLRVIQAYGGQCTCCGEKEPRFLVLDHVNEDGAAERRRLWGSQNGGGFQIILRAKKLGFPPCYQVLCWNCNFAKHRGGCPHQQKEA